MRHIGTLSDRPTAIERLRETKRRGAEWLLDRVDPDGKVSPRNEGFRFYRLPWTLTVSGHTHAAAAVCGWIREHMLTPDGDFDRGHREALRRLRLPQCHPGLRRPHGPAI